MHRLAQPLLDSPPLWRYGLPELVYGASPAVATDFTQAIEGRFYRRLLTVFCRLVTDANVANREVVVEYRDAQAQRFALMGAPVTVAAGTTFDFAYSVFQPRAEWPVDSSAVIPLHELLLAPTMDFRVHIVNVQVGDQLSRVRFSWESFYTADQPPTDGPTPG